MKKTLAVLLMATSVGAMASPTKCLKNWVNAQGGNTTQEGKTPVPNWGSNAYFQWGNKDFVIGYRMHILDSNGRLEPAYNNGPWHCHCTVTGDAGQRHNSGKYVDITGICGYW